MRVLIVHAHPEPTSFSAAMTHAAQIALRAAGHEAVVSDLHGMHFDPISDRRNFLTVANGARLKQQDEEEYAGRHDGYVPQLKAEMEKVTWCDVLILQFPLWWLGMPAILKGWIDRVFALGFAYGGGRYFDTGVFRGKRALCATTVGGSALVYSNEGIYGSIEPILFPIHHGVFRFLGFGVLAPFVVYGPARMTQEERLASLDDYRRRVVMLDSAPLLM